MNPPRKAKSVKIPISLIKQKAISHGAIRLYGLLAWFSGHKNYCCPPEDTLAKTLGVSTRQIYRYIAELEDNDAIRIERISKDKIGGVDGRRNSYLLV